MIKVRQIGSARHIPDAADAWKQAMSIPELGDSAADVATVDQFKRWIRGEVRKILPHGALACGHGRLHAAGVAMDYLVTVDFPVAHFPTIRNCAGGIDTPLMRRWFQTRMPVLFEANEPWPDIPETWLANFRHHGLINALVHAVYDEVRCIGTYFSFHRLTSPVGQDQRTVLAGITPLLHETLIRVIANLEASSGIALPELSARERQIAYWIGEGRSNGEIARQFRLSENTVKHHVSAILRKTGSENRAALAARVAASAGKEAEYGPKVL